jgi:NAD(P)-dependent dehydrogenase (short-subunit alcohol dehydrogenase family)
MSDTLDFSLNGKVAIVTGSGNPQGIGAAYSRALAGAGAAVVCADINAAGAQKVAGALVADDVRALGVGVDITDPASVHDMVRTATAEFGGVDILVNNAAMMAEITQIPVTEFSLDEWNRVIAVNLTGAMLCSQAVVPSMRGRGGGRIVNQASGGAFVPINTYGITKLALVGLTVVLAKELGRDGISVNAIAPGFVESSAGKAIAPEGSPFRERLRQAVAMREVGQPVDLCGALLLLVSPAGSWITGQTLNVDGGWVLRI